MSNFNQYFKNTGAKTIVDKFFEGIDLYTEKYKMTDLTWKIQKGEDYPASYYIENGLTATHTVELNYTINYGSEILATTFEVPKEIDGAFIIEGAYRIATNTLSNDYDCRIT